MRRTLTCGIVSTLIPLLASGQSRCPVQDRTGLDGELAAAAMRVRVGSSTLGSHAGAVGTVGFRFPLLWWPTRACWIRIMPHLAYGITGIRGIDNQPEEFGFSHLDKGLILSIRPWQAVRPYILWRTGTRTMERVEDGQIWNYSGGGHTIGGGVHFPLTRHSSGIDVGVASLQGRFKDAEMLKEHKAVDAEYRVRMIFVGWTAALRKP